jgi:inosine-uridine nucleoside N-ribohydrolase
MKREEVLQRLRFTVPEMKKKRVIVHSDIACEADDQYAIVHHLLTPSERVVGIIAAHFEWRFRVSPQLASQRYTSMGKSWEEGRKILDLMKIDDVPLIKGAASEITDPANLPDSPGADFIIQEAMKDDAAPLFVALQGCLTDLAIAYKKEPKIAERLTAIWIGGGKYPHGGADPNSQEDVLAAQMVFSSDIPLWQIPSSVYSRTYITFAELMVKVKTCGEIGKYLADEMLAVNDFYGNLPKNYPFPHGESWSIGDQPTVSVLLQNSRHDWHTEKAAINDDMTYAPAPNGREIRVYDGVDRRMTLDDFFAKLQLCYGEER